MQAWISQHCQIVPAVPRTDPNTTIGETLRGALGPATYDTLLAAQGGNFVLVSDDWHLRHLANTGFGIEGMWTQVLARYARMRGEISAELHSNVTVALTHWRYQFTSVSHEDLLVTAQKAGWKPDVAFRSLAGALTLKTNDLASLLNVVTDFLRRLWSDPLRVPPLQMIQLTSEMLDGIDPSHSDQAYRFLAGLEALAAKGFLQVTRTRRSCGITVGISCCRTRQTCQILSQRPPR